MNKWVDGGDRWTDGRMDGWSREQASLLPHSKKRHIFPLSLILCNSITIGTPEALSYSHKNQRK